MTYQPLLKRVRVWLGLFVVGLVLSGLTAFPLQWESNLLYSLFVRRMPDFLPGLTAWIAAVHEGITTTYRHYPFMAYGTDWLAFGHLVIAVAFWGPYRDPVRNLWVIEFGMIACVMVLPLALTCGPLRGIPFGWQLVDCSFGVAGLLPLSIAYRAARQIARLQRETPDAAGVPPPDR